MRDFLERRGPIRHPTPRRLVSVQYYRVRLSHGTVWGAFFGINGMIRFDGSTIFYSMYVRGERDPHSRSYGWFPCSTSLAFWILRLFVQLSANDLRAHRIEHASASNSFAPRCSGVAFGCRCIKGVHVLAMVAYCMPLATGKRES